MEIKLIKTQEEYNQVISFLEEIGDREDFETNKKLIKEFNRLSILIDTYESRNFPIQAGHPLDIIKLKMDSLDIIQNDLIGIIGTSGVVSEVFNKKRGLSKSMIRKLSEVLNLDQELLNRTYELDVQPKVRTRQAQKRSVPCFAFIGGMEAKVESFTNRVKTMNMVFNVNAYCN